MTGTAYQIHKYSHPEGSRSLSCNIAARLRADPAGDRLSINHVSFRPLSWIKSLIVSPGERALRVPIGLYRGISLELDLSSQTQAWLSLYERETHPFIRAAARTASWVIDIGAGKGELSAYFLKNTDSHVFAVDPRETDLAALARTVARNALDGTRLTVIQGYAGTDPEMAVRLDALPVDRKQRGFIKIDVDGHELDVLRSAEGLLGGGPVDFLVEVHSAELEQQTLTFLKDHGYQPAVVKNAPWRVILPEQRPVALNRWVWAQG
jgi:SAM-dependent methyltransferase